MVDIDLTALQLDDFEILLRLACAMLIGAVIGMEREYSHRPAGLRTHMLVALGSCTVDDHQPTSLLPVSSLRRRAGSGQNERPGHRGRGFSRCRDNSARGYHCERPDNSSKHLGHSLSFSGRRCRILYRRLCRLGVYACNVNSFRTVSRKSLSEPV